MQLLPVRALAVNVVVVLFSSKYGPLTKSGVVSLIGIKDIDPFSEELPFTEEEMFSVVDYKDIFEYENLGMTEIEEKISDDNLREEINLLANSKPQHGKQKLNYLASVRKMIQKIDLSIDKWKDLSPDELEDLARKIDIISRYFFIENITIMNAEASFLKGVRPADFIVQIKLLSFADILIKLYWQKKFNLEFPSLYQPIFDYILEGSSPFFILSDPIWNDQFSQIIEYWLDKEKPERSFFEFETYPASFNTDTYHILRTILLSYRARQKYRKFLAYNAREIFDEKRLSIESWRDLNYLWKNRNTIKNDQGKIEAVSESVRSGNKIIDLNVGAQSFAVTGEGVLIEAGGARIQTDVVITSELEGDQDYLNVSAEKLSLGFGGTDTDPIIGLKVDSANFKFYEDGAVAQVEEIVPVLNLSGVNLFSASDQGDAKLDLQINTRKTDYIYEAEQTVKGVTSSVETTVKANAVKLFNSNLSGELKLGLEVLGQKIEEIL